MTTHTFEPDIDSLIDSYQPDTNYGASDYVIHDVRFIGGSKATLRRGIGNFDVSALSGLTIISAQLERYRLFPAGAPYTASLSRCTRPDTWTEPGVTWNKYNGVDDWTTAGGDIDTSDPDTIVYTDPAGVGWFTIPGLAPFVTDALTNRDGIVSIILRLQAEAPGVSTGCSWYSLDKGFNIWRLVIDYEPPDPGRRSTPHPPASRIATRARPARPATGARTAQHHRAQMRRRT